MGQKISPKSMRLTLTKEWTSKWFASKKDFPLLILEDAKIRKTVMNHYGSNSGIASIIIKRNPQEVSLDIYTSKPGILIGRQGKGINDLRALLTKISTKKLHVNVIEVKKPDLVASLVAASIGNQISRRISHRRAMKQSAERVMQAGAKGVKIITSGRLNGADIARSEATVLGSIPTSSFNQDIDFAVFHAPTTFGITGIKVWIYKGPMQTEVKPEETGRPLI